MKKLANDRPVIMLTDAIASANLEVQGHIGGSLIRRSNAGRVELRNYLIETNLWLPATLKEYANRADGTYDFRGGSSMTRIDCMAVSCDVQAIKNSAEVWADFVMPNAGLDHYPTVCRLACRAPALLRFAREDELGILGVRLRILTPLRLSMPGFSTSLLFLCSGADYSC